MATIKRTMWAVAAVTGVVSSAVAVMLLCMIFAHPIDTAELLQRWL
jgi:hypothetical protein